MTPAERAGFCEAALNQIPAGRRPDPVGQSPGRAGRLDRGIQRPSVHSNNVRAGAEGLRESALTVFTPTESPEQWAATLRNIGRTHTDAVASGLGDTQDHVEAAITAFGRAATIAPEADRSQWVGAHCDLAATLRAAAPWRGTVAFEESANTYATVLRGLTRDRAPELWASLNAAHAEVLVAAGDVSRADEAIHAVERALEVYTCEATPINWAQAQLRLGQLFRRRPGGDRADNLERAAAALDAALRVYTPDAFLVQRLSAHYERGPVLVFRRGGDRNEYLRHALESLRIAAAAVPRDQAPDVWASLQVTIAQALLDRTDGDAQERIEDAIATLEAALPVIGKEPSSLSWILARRFLSQAYLERERGDPDDNLDRGIEALEAVLQRDSPDADRDAWTVAHVNLGQAYLRRRRGDRGQNRANAVAALEAAVRRHLVSAGCRRVGVRPRRGSRSWRCTTRDATFRSDAATRPSRPVKMPAWRHSRRCTRGSRRSRSIRIGTCPSCSKIKRTSSSACSPTFSPAARCRPETRRSDPRLKRSDSLRPSCMIHQLLERQSARRRTDTLLRDVQRDGRPFVLFLRGFNNRIARFTPGNVMTGTGNLEMFALTRVVADMAPLPVVWIVNPVESPALDLLVAEKQEEAMGFRIEAGDDWEQHVRTLISAAACIVMHNASMTPGVAAEIAAVAAARRLEDTLFQDPEAANRATGRSDCRRLDDVDAIDAMRARTRPAPPPPAALPPAMCPWVGGARRMTMEREAHRRRTPAASPGHRALASPLRSRARRNRLAARPRRAARRLRHGPQRADGTGGALPTPGERARSRLRAHGELSRTDVDTHGESDAELEVPRCRVRSRPRLQARGALRAPSCATAPDRAAPDLARGFAAVQCESCDLRTSRTSASSVIASARFFASSLVAPVADTTSSPAGMPSAPIRWTTHVHSPWPG